MAKEEKMTREEWESKIIVKAWKDAQFRKYLIENPKKALKEIGYTFPETAQVKVIEEQEDQWILVIPKAPANSNYLSDVELSKFAGGVLGNLITQPGFQSHSQMGCG